MALDVGLEPTTQRLTAVCSTDWANQAVHSNYIYYFMLCQQKLYLFFKFLAKLVKKFLWLKIKTYYNICCGE